MAGQLCSLCNTLKRGGTSGFYPAIVKDGHRFRSKLRLCIECLDDVVTEYSKQWSDGFILNRFTSLSTCHGCGELRGEAGSLHAAYVTCWNSRNQRFDYYAAYCDGCSDKFIQAFALTTETANAV